PKLDARLASVLPDRLYEFCLAVAGNEKQSGQSHQGEDQALPFAIARVEEHEHADHKGQQAAARLRQKQGKTKQSQHEQPDRPADACFLACHFVKGDAHAEQEQQAEVVGIVKIADAAQSQGDIKFAALSDLLLFQLLERCDIDHVVVLKEPKEGQN